MKFDYKKWEANVYELNDIQELNIHNLKKKNIILNLNIAKDSPPLIILFKNFSKIDNYDNFLVSFGGALITKGSAPYFSFNKISDDLNCPLVAISDPTLYLNDSIRLSWYSGNIHFLNLQKKIAEIIQFIATCYNKKPILTGGSGGGFASLAISSHLDIPNTCFVWNPQTNIKKYYKKYVIEYISTAFPNFTSKNIDTQFKRINQYKIISDLTLTPLNTLTDILFLQNSTDTFHLENHCMPFIKSHFLQKLDNERQTLYSDMKNKYIYIGEWGIGHIPPSRSSLLVLLKTLLQNIPVSNITLQIK